MSNGFAQESEISLSCQIPYYLGKEKESVIPGEQIQAFFNVENLGLQDKQLTASIELPAGFLPIHPQQNWQVMNQGELCQLQRQINLSGGYSQWFDLIPLKVNDDVVPGNYPVLIRAGDQVQRLVIAVSGTREIPADTAFTIDSVVLPLDKDGKTDDRLNRSTIVLRDRRWDYYKNVLQGKGATNQEMEAIHPVTHMGLDLTNPAGQQKLIVITTMLLDAYTHEPIPGLFTPSTTGENAEAGALGGHENSLVAFAALTGEAKQRIRLPVYADEQLFGSGGNYLLQVTIADEMDSTVIKEIPIKIIKQDSRAAGVVCFAVILLAGGLFFAACRFQRILRTFRTRWLVTIALFGAAAFAVVNVPSTLFGELFHILLGPFGFVISGLFSSVFLYMIVMSLVILIPYTGVIALISIIRMLLGMLAFGQFSPITFLSYGIHALFLESFLYGSGMYRYLQSQQTGDKIPVPKMALLAFICAAADCLSIYVSLQSMSVLYRMYYADWYIELILLVNGLVYTAIGAFCGVLLGKRLSKVGGD
ncbi:hypothetical protein Ga0466249_001383 [Sporomusaceae bacterium BoRhaA]|nr:hypothetical protein [Pelorhabdus rhamnosifermentans]